MDNVWLISALWVGLALIASVTQRWIAVSIALIEIIVGAVAGNLVGPHPDPMDQLSRRLRRYPFDVFGRRRNRRRCIVATFGRDDIGLVGFFAPYLAYSPLRISSRLAVAAGPDRRDRAVHDLGRRRLCGDDRDRIQQDRNRQDHSRRLLRQRSRHRSGARCRLRQLQSLAIGFAAATVAILFLLPRFTPWFFAGSDPGQRTANKVRAFASFALGGLAITAKSEAVLPAYLIGMVLAPTFLETGSSCIACG